MSLASFVSHGFTRTADTICDHLEESLEGTLFAGGIFTGTEFFTWEGAPRGYEGFMSGPQGAMIDIAQHRGWIEPLDPEWLPA